MIIPAHTSILLVRGNKTFRLSRELVRRPAVSHVSVEGLYNSAEAEMRLFATQQATSTLPAKSGVEDLVVWTVAMLKAAVCNSGLAPKPPRFQAWTVAFRTKDEI